MASRDALKARLSTITDEMESVGRHEQLTKAQELRFSDLQSEFNSVAFEINDIDRQALRSLVDGGGAKFEDGTPGGNDGRTGNGDPWASTSRPAFGVPAARAELRSRALTANEQCGSMPDAAREHMATALQADPDPESRLARYVIATSAPDYLRAFTHWLNDPMTGHREWDTRELAAYQLVKSETRAMALGAGGTGGFLVPYALDPQILIAGTGSVNPMRELATVLPTAQNETRVVTSLGVTASWDAEAAEVSDDSPTLVQPALTAFKGQSFLPVSVELFEDSDIQTQIGTLLADAKAQLESTAFTLGNGTTAPEGVITGVSAVGGSVVTSALTVLSLVDIIANQNALPPRWRPNAKWMANLTMINAARQIPLYANGPSIVNDATTPPRSLGWQLYENSAMDGTIAAGTTNDYVWLSGDFKRGYQIRDRIGTMLEFIPTLFGAALRPTGQRGFHMHWRTAGKVIIPDAFRLTNYSG